MIKKMSGQSQAISLLLFFLLFILNSVSTESAADLEQQCADGITKVAMCLNYATGKATNPSKECCTSVKEIKDSEPECLCYFIQQAHNGSAQIKSLGIQETKLLQLPTACSLKNASISNCPKLLGLPANSPDAAIFTNNASTVAPPGGTIVSPTDASNESNNGTRLGRHLAGLMAMVLAIFLFAFPAGSETPFCI